MLFLSISSDSFGYYFFAQKLSLRRGIFKKSVYECKQTSLIPGRGPEICLTEHFGPLGSLFFFFFCSEFIATRSIEEKRLKIERN